MSTPKYFQNKFRVGQPKKGIRKQNQSEYLSLVRGWKPERKLPLPPRLNLQRLSEFLPLYEKKVFLTVRNCGFAQKKYWMEKNLS